MRLDRFICKHSEYSQKQARFLVASGRVQVANVIVTDGRHDVTPFCTVLLDGEVLQAKQAHYLMLNKPAGYLSATSDPEHKTVLELIDASIRSLLHIGGRLDLHSTGLLILTNDGRWSRRLTEPKQKLPKVYLVETLWPITPETEVRFAEGIYLATEDITTQPAQLEMLESCKARLTIYEGRYHQIKRMFQQLDNMVIALHRESMGDIVLDGALKPGQYRRLTEGEVASV